MKPYLNFRVVALGLLGVTAIAALLLTGRATLNSVHRSEEELEHKALISIATTASAAFDIADIAKLKGPDQNIAAPEYQNIVRRLRRLHTTLPDARYVYLLGAQKEKIIFLADAENPDSSDYSEPGEVYTEATPLLWSVFLKARPTVEGPMTDRWGTWVSGLAPIVDPKSGRVLAVIGFDVPAAAWQHEIDSERFFGSALISVVGILFVLFGFSALWQARARKRIALLNDDLRVQVNELAQQSRIVENSSTVVFRIDLKELRTLSYISRNVDRYGYQCTDLLGDSARWWALFHEDDRAAISADVARIAKGVSTRVRRELRFKKADGSWAWVDARLSVVTDELRRRVAIEGIMFDISDVKKVEEQIAHLATHDALTGLVNRAAFSERLQMAFADTKRNGELFAVLYLDVDHFKDVNDAFGHVKGDLLLKAVAERLAGTLRATDMLGRFAVARFGGDEFAVLQTAVSDAGDAATLAQRLLKELAEPFDIEGNEIHITASIGISLYDASIAEPKDMLMQADLALYRAKDAGRNQFHFHSTNLDIEVRERVSIGEDLHAAIQNDELELHYQPQVEIPSGKIIGMEALIRWHHPERGMIWPDVFIPVAEKTGIVNALGQWAVRRACRQIRSWREDGLDPPIVGINVSAVQFRNSETLIAAIEEALKDSAVESANIELELTESVLVETTQTHSDILKRLRKLGLHIAIDDFGTGYSSLQYLHSYPIDRIKIAQQFMQHVTGAGGDAAIVRAVIELGRALGLRVIAEGVETAAQASFLASADCHEIQGYYFSPPVRADAMAQFMRAGKFIYPRPQEQQRAIA